MPCVYNKQDFQCVCTIPNLVIWKQDLGMVCGTKQLRATIA